MREAVIVSTARTGLAKSFRGALNNTHGAAMGGHATKHAIQRAKIDPGEVEDVIVGCANPEGATGGNIARQIAISAGCPVTVSGVTVNRFCSSGLQTIATAAQRIQAGEGDIFAAGGVESISLVQNQMNKSNAIDPWLKAHKPDIYLSMLQTAENVAKRYGIARQLQDEYGVESQRRAAAARQGRKFDDEIVPFTTSMTKFEMNDKKEVVRTWQEEVTLNEDEGIRADTTYEGVSKIRPALEGGVIAAGNASQFSDGASMAIVMDGKLAEQRNLQPLGIFKGFAVAGCEPDEMGIGPVFAVPKLLKRAGLKVEDIDLWELNEAFAVQVIYSRDKLGIPKRPAERQRRRDCRRPSLWRVGRAPRRPRADRGQAPRRETRGCDNVYRWWHGRCRLVRGRLTCLTDETGGRV
jgi:acetyl-CoA C-acetyltransferase